MGRGGAAIFCQSSQCCDKKHCSNVQINGFILVATMFYVLLNIMGHFHNLKITFHNLMQPFIYLSHLKWIIYYSYWKQESTLKPTYKVMQKCTIDLPVISSKYQITNARISENVVSFITII